MKLTVMHAEQLRLPESPPSPPPPAPSLCAEAGAQCASAKLGAQAGGLSDLAPGYLASIWRHVSPVSYRGHSSGVLEC